MIIRLSFLLCLLAAMPATLLSQNARRELAFCDFSKLSTGNFGEFATEGFPEYHYIPRKFTDGWDIVNNRGPEEWKVLESDGKRSLYYLGYNSTVWTYEYIYPILSYGDPLWSDYTLEVTLTPFSRKDLNGIIFRYHDGRHYYLFALDSCKRVTLRYRNGEKGFRQDGWYEIASASFATDSLRAYRLNVEAAGDHIICRIDGTVIFDVHDNKYSGGKIGLFATCPVAFHQVRVETSQDTMDKFLSLKAAMVKEEEELRQENPGLTLWKRISTRGFGVSRAMRLGDLDGDGRTDFLLVQNLPFFGDNYNQITCITALDNDGNMLWQHGTPDPEHAWVSYDVAAQIHDLDRDGQNEVIMAEGPWIKVLEGSTGKEKSRFHVPSSEIKPDEKSWLEYRHYYRRDLLPYLNVDCISFADLRGAGKDQDIIIKDRHTRLWAYNNHFELLWTASANLGHFPTFYDSNGDGRDEVYIGYSKFDPDGKLLWTLDGQMEEHADGICVGDFSLKGGKEKVFIGGSDDGVLMLDETGKIIRHHLVGHAQTPSAGQYRPDIPGLEFCEINFWGEPGLITLYDCNGNEITNFELIHEGSPVQPVNWKGDGTEFIFLSPNPVEGGLIDGWGRRVVMFPDDGHPDLAWMACDMTGDPRDELIVWDTERIYIYTQDRPYSGEKIYAPKRPPLYNESNYAPVVSWPGWKEQANAF
jgi:rhamnogalacturonan endolyase